MGKVVFNLIIFVLMIIVLEGRREVVDDGHEEEWKLRQICCQEVNKVTFQQGVILTLGSLASLIYKLLNHGDQSYDRG